MKIKLTLSFVIFLFFELVTIPSHAQILADTGYVQLELFQNPYPNIQDVATNDTTQTFYLDTLETQYNWSHSSRIRGYLIPPQTGYFKFSLLSYGTGTLYLSSDSAEYHKRLILSNNQSQWPASLEGLDSVFLVINHPYYFEVMDGSNILSYIKLRWALPDSSFLQPITGKNLAGIAPKPVRSEVVWEIFENKVAADFNTLLNTDTVPDKTVNLLSLSTNDFSTSIDHFESRIRGYIIPPVSGSYSFYFAADNISQFWLSTDDSQANEQLKSEILFAQSDWTQNVSSQSLIAGEKYFFEILHYDSTYTDQIKLGWKIPGDSLPNIIGYNYLIGFDDGVLVTSFKIKKTDVLAYTNWTLPIAYQLLPWNASDKSILWRSSDDSIATVNSSGLITTINPGICQIIGCVAQDTTLKDTLYLVVTNYPGPYFVKPDIIYEGDGHSWNTAMNLTTLLDILNQGKLTQQITIYASEGIYKPTQTIDRTKSFLMNNVRLVGGYAATSSGTDTTDCDIQIHETVLSGEIGNQSITYDNSYHVITTIDNTNYWGWTLPNNFTIIEGVTISNGRASCSTYGAHGTFSINDNGGGIFIKGSKVRLVNCRIFNNSAWSRAGGIFTQGGDHVTSELLIQNTSFESNLIQQTTIQPNGSIFEVIINGYGAALVIAGGTYNISNCMFFNNHGYCRTIALENCSGDIDKCSFFNNIGSDDDIFVSSSSLLNINNSTVERKIWVFTNSCVNLKNSTVGVFGGGGSALSVNSINCDNSIVKSLCNSLLDSLVSAKYSIIGNTLVGSDKSIILSDSIPNSSLWLDTIAFNGGPTPTMRLKNIPFNPAKSMGNPLYLDSLDQRGYVRKDSVSIGAYQWIRPDSISVAAASNSICQGDSAMMDVTFFPPYVDDSTFLIQNINDTIAFSDSVFVHALSAGNAPIVVSANDGNKSDTLLVDVIGTIGTGTISGDSIVCQGDGAVVYQVTPIENATDYVWALPSGASGNSSSNSISVDYDLTATSGPISVTGQNVCFNGSEILFPVLVNDKPATPVISIQVDTLFSNAASGNQWYSDNGAIAGANSQYYIVTENGNYYVVVSNDGCNSDPSNIITMINVGLNENDVFLSIYPNPATNQITISGIESGGTLRLYDLTGKLLLERENRDNTLDVSGVEAGCYVLEVRTESGVLYGRVVVE